MLWGGILEVIPTAIPDVPFNNKLGTLEGRTIGSFIELSKLGVKFTVFFSISSSILSANLLNLASVYLWAAGGSPSTLPQFP